VFRARSDAGGTVALKVLHPDANARALARFAREATAAAAIQHPGVVRVVDHGRTEAGQAWLAMEHVEGESLDRRLARGGPLEPIAAARLVTRLAHAVHAAHERGVIHRDLKPANVLLVEGDLDRPKVADFGLAAIEGAERLTRSNGFVGTPAYLAPELIRGVPAGPASDVYALGATLYEILVGRPPFLGASVAAVLDRALSARPVPPRALRGDVPAALERVCFNCLEKAPAHRPPSAASVARALERFTGERRAGPAGQEVRERVADAGAAARRWFTFAMGLLVGLQVGALVGLHLAARGP
jgi:serine/threonine protein kinase